MAHKITQRPIDLPPSSVEDRDSGTTLTIKSDGLPRLGYNTKEAAAILGFRHEDSVLKLVHKGELKPLSGFRKFIIPLCELERFCRESIQTDGGKKKGRAN
jgi:hypothetical protein